MKSMLRALRSRIGKSVQDAEASQGGRVFYLVAEPGYPNYGDELIAGEWLKLLGERYPDVPVVVDCARPGPAAVILKDKHPHAIFTDTLRRLGTENSLPYDGPINDIAAFVRRALDDESIAPNYASGIRSVSYTHLTLPTILLV